MIIELLHKLKWDKSENPDDYKFMYRDMDRYKTLLFKEIVNIDGSFIQKYNEDNVLVSIPVHRIKRIYKKGKIILQR